MVNKNDTSDDVRSLACPEFDGDLEKQEAWLGGWQECRRRYEAQMEERDRKAFEAGFDCGIDDLDLNECYRAFREAKK